MHAILTQNNKHVVQYLYSAVLDHYVHFNLTSDPKYYNFSLIFCWPPNCYPYQTNFDEYAANHILLNPKLPKVSDKYILKNSTICLKLKMFGN